LNRPLRAGKILTVPFPRSLFPRTNGNTIQRVRRWRGAALVGALVALLLIGGSGAVHADTQSKLNAARARLHDLLARVESARHQQAVLQAQLNQLAAQIGRVQSDIDQTQGRINELRRQIERIQTKVDGQQETLDTRARIAYESGTGTTLEFVLGSTSITDLNDRLEIIDAAARSDQSIIDDLTTTKNQLSQRQEALVETEGVLRAKQRSLTTSSDALSTKLAKLQRILASLEHDRAQVEHLVGNLTAKLLSELGGGGSGGIGGVFQVCPVDSPHAYSDDFGQYRGTTNPPHPHAGNDIFAPRGIPIRAPFSGTAVDASGGLGGRAVVVYGSLGYVYNAHLSGIGTLGSVSAGTVIGYVGNTGDARGGATHDHFEWHPSVLPKHLWRSPYGYTRIGSAIDPYPYLNSVC
jgi:peptidoglycan hydrolase CwlO-like protein